jgi:OmcA/MtrC family decaheme c-type cytochrome
VTIDAVSLGAVSTVNFTVKDGIGRGAIGLLAGSTGGNLRFTLAKLVEGSSGSSNAWHSYINKAATAGGNTVKQATFERNGTLEDHGDGTYTYTFLLDVTKATDPVTNEAITYVETIPHRLGLQVAEGGLPRVNETIDFVPDGSAVNLTRNITRTASCNSCHGSLNKNHGGYRYDAKYCVTCHNDTDQDPATLNSIGMTEMVHKIHMGMNLPSVVAGGEYKLGSHDYSHVGMPMSVNNCAKCHSAGNTDTPDGDNWNIKPTMKACGSCHDNITFAGATAHKGQTTNAGCSGCHPASEIKKYHMTDVATPNNPDVTTGLDNFEFEISSVTVNASNQAVVRFRIMRGTTAMVLTTLPADLTGGPSFLLAYALPQDGINNPADYNNLGRPAAQPATVSLANLRSGTAGTLTADSNGFYIATITSTTFPAGATMRAVALQGYFSQVLNTVTYGRYTPSVILAATGDAKRREIVDDNKCLSCHEHLALHGGNRVNNTAVCLTCHNPNLSASGKTLDLNFEEDTNNFKELIHGIHASAVRENPYKFVRVRAISGTPTAFPFDWSHVTYPNDIGNCLACHKEGTYTTSIPSNALATTFMTTDGLNATPADVTAARNTVPNATDRIHSPTASACYYCHDSAPSVAHMQQNGGAVNKTRATTQSAESCTVCHGPGRYADVENSHGIR